MKNLYICKHENGHGYCLLNDEYCPQSPCKDEEIITYAPVKHGKWVKMPSKEVEEATWCCSECSYPVGIWMIKENFCPNCGARMTE